MNNPNGIIAKIVELTREKDNNEVEKRKVGLNHNAKKIRGH